MLVLLDPWINIVTIRIKKDKRTFEPKSCLSPNVKETLKILQQAMCVSPTQPSEYNSSKPPLIASHRPLCCLNMLKEQKLSENKHGCRGQFLFFLIIFL